MYNHGIESRIESFFRSAKNIKIYLLSIYSVKDLKQGTSAHGFKWKQHSRCKILKYNQYSILSCEIEVQYEAGYLPLNMVVNDKK